MKGLEVKAVYTVPELGRMMGVNKKRLTRLLKRMHVPVQPGCPGIVLLADLKVMAPAVWSSLEEAAHLVLVATGWMILAPVGETANPMDVGFLGLDRHMLEAQDVARGFNGLV